MTIPVKLDTPSSSACLGGSSRRKYGRSAEKFRDNPSPFIRLASVPSKDCASTSVPGSLLSPRRSSSRREQQLIKVSHTMPGGIAGSYGTMLS